MKYIIVLFIWKMEIVLVLVQDALPILRRLWHPLRHRLSNTQFGSFSQYHQEELCSDLHSVAGACSCASRVCSCASRVRACECSCASRVRACSCVSCVCN